MTAAQFFSAVLYVALAAVVVARQLSTRRIDRRALLVPMVLLAIGADQTWTFARSHTISGFDLVSLLLSLLVSTTLAFPRAHSMHVWHADGSWWSRGTITTLVLWIVTFLVRFAVTAAAAALTGRHAEPGFVAASALLTAAVSLGVQALIRMRRT